MNTIKLLLDPLPFHRKPKGNEIGSINNRIANTIKEISTPNKLANLARKIGSNGHTFCPATFKENRRSKETFEQQQLFALDFDNKDSNNSVTFNEIKKRADYYNLPVLFAYDTLTSIAHNKFRVVFLNDISILDRKVAEAIQLALGEIFHEADSSCYKDVSKMYFGGKELLYYDNSIHTINVSAVFQGLESYYMEYDKSGKHFKEKIIRFSQRSGITLNNHGYLAVTHYDDTDDFYERNHLTEEKAGASNVTSINGGNSPNTIIIYNIKDNGENPPFSYYKIILNGTSNSSVGRTSPRRTADNHKKYRSDIIEKMKEKCRLFQEFETGTKDLGHEELFGISTNMINVETGERIFMDIISKFYPDKINKWKNSLRISKGHNYHPKNCCNFCHYYDECSHGKNMLTTVQLKRGELEKVGQEEQYYSLKEVQEDVQQAIKRAYYKTCSHFQIIKAQVGIGKSYSYKKIMSENPQDRFLIACPTNLLKNEIYNDTLKLGIDVRKTPSLDEIIDVIPNEIKNKIQKYRIKGQHQLIHPYIQEVLKTTNEPSLKEYMKQREELRKSNSSIITTHRYLLTMSRKQLREFDSIIIDEDIIFKSIISNQGEISVLKLKKMLKKITNPQLRNKIKTLLKKSKNESYISLDGFELDYNTLSNEENKIKFDIPSFCTAEYFAIRKKDKEPNLKEDTITFLKSSNFFDDINYIIVSATVDETICNHFFSNKNISFYECKKAEYKGQLLQYPIHSFSRSFLKEHQGLEKYLIKELSIDENHFITFLCEDIGILHFGNTEGSNILEGKDIIILGTPYHAEFLYKLVALSMGLDFNKDEKMIKQEIVYNGYRFWFTTFKNENLRAVHFWMLESELVQAIGRARLLRHNCKVHLFSNFPMEQAIMVTDHDYVEEWNKINL